ETSTLIVEALDPGCIRAMSRISSSTVHKTDYTSRCECIAFSHDGQRIAGGKHGEVKVWDVRTGHLLYSLDGFSNGTSRLAFSPDSRHLVSAHYDATVRVWDMATGHRE